jgi:hypothetical protein
MVSVVGFAQMPPVRRGSTVYIEPMDGYEAYLAAAFQKKQVPVIVVTDRVKAEYIITSSLVHRSLNNSTPNVIVNNTVNNGTPLSSNPVAQSTQRGYEEGVAQRRALGETSASIEVLDPQSSRIVFAYSAGKMGTKQLQKTAEDCAKHLKEFIEKPKK